MIEWLPVLFLFCAAKTEKEPKRPKLVADALPGVKNNRRAKFAKLGAIAPHTIPNFKRSAQAGSRAKATTDPGT